LPPASVLLKAPVCVSLALFAAPFSPPGNKLE
jgi:hypothetical protein